MGEGKEKRGEQETRYRETTGGDWAGLTAQNRWRSLMISQGMDSRKEGLVESREGRKGVCTVGCTKWRSEVGGRKTGEGRASIEKRGTGAGGRTDKCRVDGAG